MARGVFLINDSLIETDLIGYSGGRAQNKIYQKEIAPGDSCEIEIKTMPQPGSNYPVTLLMKANVIK